MAVTITLNPRFKKLNGGGVDLLHKQNTPNRERRAVCTVVIDAEDYLTGGIVLDFSVIRKFKEVYGLSFLQFPIDTLLGEFIPGSDSTDARIKLYDAFATEEANATSTTITFICEIYGI